MKIVDMDAILDRVHAELIRVTVHQTASHAATRQDHREAGVMMVATALRALLLLVELR